MQHGVIWEKVICNELANLTFICNKWLEQMWVRGGHCREEDFTKVRNQSERGGRDHEEDDEK
jgi:hypothetical protein